MPDLWEELTAPVSSESFCGEDGGYEPEFEAAKAEIEKLSGNDFASVESNCRRLVRRKSKDMRALGFLCLASGLTQGTGAFAQAVRAYADLVQSHWDDIYPRRPAGRANALRWLNGERVLSLLGSLPADPAAHEDLAAAAEGLRRLRELSREKFPDNEPSFGGFLKLVENLAALSRPKEEPPVSPVQAGEPAGAGASAGGPAAPAIPPARQGAPAPPADLQSAADAETALQKAAQVLLRERPSDPLAYRIMRILRWGSVVQVPPNESGVTPIPPPDGEMAGIFAGLHQSHDWKKLAEGAEKAFTRDDMLFWFDLQRYLCAALTGLGGSHAACAQAVVVELALLLKRLPALAGLQFENGQPFADPHTRDWIQETVKKAVGEGSGPATVKLKGDVGRETEQAGKLQAEGKLEEALGLLRAGLANDSNPRNNFQRRLFLAELCYKARKCGMALGVLEELRSLISRHALEEWEPDLCVSVYALAHKARGGLMAEAGEAEKERLKEANRTDFLRLSRLDPLKALEFELG